VPAISRSPVRYFNPEAVPESSDEYMYIIEITSVYKGSKYRNTCIAEAAIE